MFRLTTRDLPSLLQTLPMLAKHRTYFLARWLSLSRRVVGRLWGSFRVEWTRPNHILEVYILLTSVFPEGLASTAKHQSFMVTGHLAQVFHFFDGIIIVFKNRIRKEGMCWIVLRMCWKEGGFVGLLMTWKVGFEVASINNQSSSIREKINMIFDREKEGKISV